jgi:hypothetical protein
MLFPRSLQTRETVHKPHGKTVVHTRTGIFPGSNHGVQLTVHLGIHMQPSTEITHKPTTRPSEHLVCAAEMTEGIASPGSTAPAACIFGLKCRGAELDALVLQRWRHLFYQQRPRKRPRHAPGTATWRRSDHRFFIRYPAAAGL